MRIIIFSDSLGRPRPDLDGVDVTRISDVYGEKIKKHFASFCDVDLIYVESMDSQDAIFWGQRMVAFREPDIVIFHFGINDCAPRLFKKNSRNIIFNKTFRKITFDVFLRMAGRLRYYITRIRKISYFNSTEFIENISSIEREILKYNSKCKFYFVGIASSEIMDNKSYNYNQNISLFNNKLQKKYGDNYIDVNVITNGDTGLISDCVHLTKDSHAKLAKEIISRLGI